MTTILTDPNILSSLDKRHIPPRTGNCNSLKDGADGHLKADAVSSAVPKRFEDAIADNDYIQGVILIACTNHSIEAVSIKRLDGGA